MSHDPTAFAAPQGDLRTFLHDLVGREPPKRRTQPQPTPRERSWSPDAASPVTRNARVLAARAEVQSFFKQLPEMKVVRQWSAEGRGRRKRFNSLVSGRPMMAASSLEFDALMDLELDATNCWYAEKPLHLRYDWGESWRTTQPDLLVVRPSGIECVEIEYEVKAGLDDAERKWAAIGAGLRTIGLGYRVLTERHVRRQPRFANVKAIFACRHVRVDAERVQAVLNLLDGCAELEAGDLAGRLGLSLEQVWSLARRLHLMVDLEAGPLGPRSKAAARPRVLRSPPRIGGAS